MMPSMGLKFLRDGMDSANIVANLNFAGGQESYNFFEGSLHTVLEDDGFDLETADEKITLVFNHAKKASNFIFSVGVSELSRFDQYGQKIQEPHFPYSLRFEPSEHLSYEDPDYSVKIFDRLSATPIGLLYKVYAMDKPSSLGGEEQLIALIILKSELKESLWGD